MNMMVVRTYAFQGQTPELSVPLTRDHLSVIGGLAPEGHLFMQWQDSSYKGPDVVRFLRLLLREIPGKILLVWDGARIHSCQCAKDFLVQGAAQRLHLERFQPMHWN
ncbi:hypothetical protein KDH_01980 [Dictyobacter sp. S3.2.2.5]|uniref:Tc1-like transposase DDE domain-containing protein n=1 Tax=Dictyobacter halimunensis TaxID=3026934 RepID=A0ABQ6FH62_9CHLR|nr:hypothetical protein KDH_01980 [Dictyobacter sp. S3.2.2.5]